MTFWTRTPGVRQRRSETVLVIAAVRPRVTLGKSVLAVAAAALVLVLPATAGSPGAWSPVIVGGGFAGTSQIGVARTKDGMLHLVWSSANSASSDRLLHRTNSPSGVPGPTSVVADRWSAIDDAALLFDGTKLMAFFGGGHSTVTGDPQIGLNLATSTDGGRSWSLAPAAIATSQTAGRTPSLTLVNGVPLQAWYAVGEPVVHVGLDPNAGISSLYSPPGTSVDIVSDRRKPYVAWCSATDGKYGVWVQEADPQTGNPVGQAQKMPLSTVTAEGKPYLICPVVNTRIGLAARAGGGVYTGVWTRGGVDPKQWRVVVWKVGTTRPLLHEARNNVRENVALAADDDGHVWVAWTEGTTLYASRSNKAGNRFGAIVATKGPASQADTGALDISAQVDRLDALVRYTDGRQVRGFHTQVYPGLTLRATGGKTVSFRVTDAGDPIAGATVKVAGKTLTTNAQGETPETDLPPGALAAVASKVRYVPASARVRSE